MTTTTTAKVNLFCFKIHRCYSMSFNLSKVGEFFWGFILKDCIYIKYRIKNGCMVFTFMVCSCKKTWYACQVVALGTWYLATKLKQFYVWIRRSKNITLTKHVNRTVLSNNLRPWSVLFPLAGAQPPAPIIKTQQQKSKKVKTGTKNGENMFPLEKKALQWWFFANSNFTQS